MRVRLLGDAGVHGSAARGLRGLAGELEPRDDHDRPDVRGPDLYRAARSRLRLVGARARASGRAPADAGWADRSERRGRARGVGRPGSAGRPADRRELGGHPSRGGPERVQTNDAEGRSRGPGGGGRALGRGGALDRRCDRLPGDRPPVVHVGRRREWVRAIGGGARGPRAAEPRDIPGRRDPRRGVDRGLEGVRAGGHARR